MKKITVFLAALTVLTICSCGQPTRYDVSVGESEVAFQKGLGDLSQSYDGRDRLPQELTESSPQSSEREPERTETAERKIIKQGNIKFATEDIDETKSFIAQTVQELHGYISEDNAEGYSHRIEHRLTIRVPADKFDSLLQMISESVSKFDSKKIEALDVTEEYIDVAARIKTKKELQSRYAELLNQAANVDEILRIEREIGNLQTEIESVEGRMRYLVDRIAFSTLNVLYYQEIAHEGSYRFMFFVEIADGFKRGWEGFLWFLVGLSHFWVFILLMIATIFCVKLRRKKK